MEIWCQMRKNITSTIYYIYYLYSLFITSTLLHPQNTTPLFFTFLLLLFLLLHFLYHHHHRCLVISILLISNILYLHICYKWSLWLEFWQGSQCKNGWNSKNCHYYYFIIYKKKVRSLLGNVFSLLSERSLHFYEESLKSNGTIHIAHCLKIPGAWALFLSNSFRMLYIFCSTLFTSQTREVGHFHIDCYVG
jgi:hypothetical protein